MTKVAVELQSDEDQIIKMLMGYMGYNVKSKFIEDNMIKPYLAHLPSELQTFVNKRLGGHPMLI